MRNRWLWIVITLLVPLYAVAQINDHKRIGRASFHYYFWHVYDATLYSDAGSFSFDQPFILELEYQRSLKGDAIADRSTEEIRDLGFSDELTLATWNAQMKALFPNVESGVRLKGVYKPGEATEFYHNDRLLGIIRDSNFGRWFFGIWLHPDTSEPQLRRQLLGEE